MGCVLSLVCLLTASTQCILACPVWRLLSTLTLVLPDPYLGVGKPPAASAASTLATTARCSIVEILLLAGLSNLCAIVSLSNDLITIIPLHTYGVFYLYIAYQHIHSMSHFGKFTLRI